jgi:hypothetical protein
MTGIAERTLRRRITDGLVVETDLGIPASEIAKARPRRRRPKGD